MNIYEMLEAIPRQFPGVVVLEPEENDRSPDWNWFRVNLPNGWILSCGYGREHYSDGRTRRIDPKEATMVEIAIFDSSGEWYLAEGMVLGSEGSTGVLGWQNSSEVFQIVDYISKKETKS